MDEDMENKISQIIGALKNQFSSDGVNDSANNRDEPEKENKSNLDMSDDTINMMIKMKKIMEQQNKKDDPTKNLLFAIKPFLKKSRQDRIGNCVKLLGMSKMMQYADIFNDK